MPCYDSSTYESRLTQQYHFINLMRILMLYNQNIKLPLVQRLYNQTNKQVLNILHKAWVHYNTFWFTASSQKSVQQLDLFQRT